VRPRSTQKLTRWKASVGEWRAENADRVCAAAAGRVEAARIAALPPREPWPPLSDDERAEVHALLDKLSTEHVARIAEHRQRLMSSARRLGREVAAHRVTLADAEARLNRLALTLDQDEPPIAGVPYREAVAIVRDAFAEGLGGSSCPS
jgi:hypothetical protein